MTTRTCKVCGCQKEAAQGIWVMRRGKPEGRTCLACASAASRGSRATEDGRAKARAAVNKHRQKVRATEDGRAKANAASVKSHLARLKTDSWFRLRRQLATDTNRLLKQLAKNKGTDAACIKLFGQPRAICLTYFEHQLAQRGWTWDDYLAGGIEADHRIPFGLAQDSNELRTLALLENVQLLSRAENAIKAIADRELIRQHEA